MIMRQSENVSVLKSPWFLEGLRAFTAGVLGAFAFSALEALVRMVGFSSLNLEVILGTALLGNNTGGGLVQAMHAFIVGLPVHLALGGLVGLIYLGAFRAIGRWGTNVGVNFGLVHWLLASLVLGAWMGMSGAYRHWVAPWPYFGGSRAYAEFLVLHVLYGAIVGRLCASIGTQVSLGLVEATSFDEWSVDVDARSRSRDRVA